VTTDSGPLDVSVLDAAHGWAIAAQAVWQTLDGVRWQRIAG
jgi:hypothetical protein